MATQTIFKLTRDGQPPLVFGYTGAGHGSMMHLIAVDVWPVLKVGLSVCRVIDFKQRYVQISLLKLFALIFYTSTLKLSKLNNLNIFVSNLHGFTWRIRTNIWDGRPHLMLGYKGTGQGSSMHLIAVDVWPVLKAGLSVCRVIDFKQRYVQISLLKLFALVFYT